MVILHPVLAQVCDCGHTHSGAWWGVMRLTFAALAAIVGRHFDLASPLIALEIR
jgi:hypothetical protein